MKRVLCLVSVFWMAGLVWGQDEFPKPTMEMVNFSPESYVGMTVVFENASFKPDFRKISEFENVLYTFYVKSKNGDSYIEIHYHSLKDSEEINFYVAEAFAGELINEQLEPGYHKANLTCIIERLTGTAYDDQSYPCWMCKVIKIEELDDEGNIIATYTETGSPLPESVCEAGILSERERWDADGDNKIGLAEAIRALQIAAGK